MLRRHRSIGAWGERKAALYLSRTMYVIWRRNWRDKWGEIDLVAIRDRTVIFVEVKTRSTGTTDLLPDDQMTRLKLRRLRRAVRSFLDIHRIELRRRSVRSARLDFIGIVTGIGPRRRIVSLNHIEDAYALFEESYHSATNTRSTLP